MDPPHIAAGPWSENAGQVSGIMGGGAQKMNRWIERAGEKNHMHIFRPYQNTCEVSKESEELCTQGTHFDSKSACKTTRLNLPKNDKNYVGIISESHAHLQTMIKTPMKFQNNWNETVGGVTHTRYPQYIHLISNNS